VRSCLDFGKREIDSEVDAGMREAGLAKLAKLELWP
jgi:hypothetical protein